MASTPPFTIAVMISFAPEIVGKPAGTYPINLVPEVSNNFSNAVIQVKFRNILRQFEHLYLHDQRD